MIFDRKNVAHGSIPVGKVMSLESTFKTTAYNTTPAAPGLEWGTLAAGTDGYVLTCSAAAAEGVAWAAPATNGTVTSVSFTGDGTVLSSTASTAVTASGTVTAALATHAANLILAGPTTGGAVAPTFRALVAADMPSGILISAGNTVFGTSSIPLAATGTSNVAIGATSLQVLTSGNYNVAIGAAALQANMTGTQNLAIGTSAITSNISSSNNVAVGVSALTNTTAGQNTAIGGSAGAGVVTGNNNVFIGYMAGKYETGSNVIMIDSLDRTNLAGGHAGAPFYAVTNTTPLGTSQIVQFNCGAMGFYGTAAIAKPVGGGGNATTTEAGSGTGVFTNTSFPGASGASAYTIGDIVTALKALGLLTA